MSDAELHVRLGGAGLARRGEGVVGAIGRSGDFSGVRVMETSGRSGDFSGEKEEWERRSGDFSMMGVVRAGGRRGDFSNGGKRRSGDISIGKEKAVGASTSAENVGSM